MTWPLVWSYSPNMTSLDFVSLITWRLGPMFSQNKYPFYLAHHVFFSSHLKRVTLWPTTIKVGNPFRVLGCCDLLENAFRTPLPRIARSHDSEGLNLKMLGGKNASSQQCSVGSYLLQFLERWSERSITGLTNNTRQLIERVHTFQPPPLASLVRQLGHLTINPNCTPFPFQLQSTPDSSSYIAFLAYRTPSSYTLVLLAQLLSA
jgi:hypothetical protein